MRHTHRRFLALPMVTLTLAVASIVQPAVAERVALTGATVHTVSGETLDNATVVLNGPLIEAVLPNAGAPDGTRRIALDGKHLYPGLINASTLLGLYEIRDARATRDDHELGQWNPHLRAEVAINPDSQLLPVTRASGVLAFLTYPSAGRISGTAALMFTAGWTWEQMIVRAPVGMVVDWPSMRLSHGAEMPLDEQRSEREQQLDELDQVFAESRVYARAREAGTVAEDVKWEAMLPVVRGEIPIIVRTTGLPQIRTALEWAEDQGVRLIVVAARDAGLAAAELAARHVPVILEGSHLRMPRASEPYDTLNRDAALLHAAGVSFAFATGMSPYGTYNARQLGHLAGRATAFDLPAAAAVRAMTLAPAEIFGVADRMGSIEAGKEATLIATDGDILDIRTRVTEAWIRGEDVDLRNKHDALYERYRARPRPAKQ